MQPAHPGTDAPSTEVSLEPSKGWHVTHSFYAFDRARLAGMDVATRAAGASHFAEVLAADGPGAPRRLQAWIVPGHKADFGVVAMDPSPLAVESVHQRLLAGPFGPASVRWPGRGAGIATESSFASGAPGACRPRDTR